MTSPDPPTKVGVKVTKKPSEEAHWSAPKLQEEKKVSFGTGTPVEATANTPIGQGI